MPEKEQEQPVLRYSVLLQWSEEDQTFVVILPEWADQYRMPIADGETWQEAVERARNAVESYVMFALEDGKELPRPNLFRPVTPTAIPPSRFGDTTAQEVHGGTRYYLTFPRRLEEIRVTVKDGKITGIGQQRRAPTQEILSVEHLLGQPFEAVKRMHELAGGMVLEEE